MHLFVAYMNESSKRRMQISRLSRRSGARPMEKIAPLPAFSIPASSLPLLHQAGFDAVFTGAAVSMHEAKILPYRFDAIQDRRTPEISRRFLLELTYDEFGMPWYRGHRAGLDACFLLTPR